MDSKEGKGMKSLARGRETSAVSLKDKPWYPSMNFTDKDFPELDGKDVGDTVTFTFQGKINGISKYGDGDTSYSFDLIKGKIGA